MSVIYVHSYFFVDKNGLGYPKKGLKKDSIFGKIQTKYGLEEAN